MNIVYASNDNYARHLAVSMCSLMDRNRLCESIKVYVLSIGLSSDNVGKLEKIADEYGRELKIVEIENLRERLEGFTDTGRYDLSTMARLFVGEVLPQDIDRVLYLDCDTVVVQSLEKLWVTDLGDCIMGAVMEPTIYKAVKEAIDLREEDPYYNAGVLLIDLKRWRQENIQQQLVVLWKEKKGKLFANDQDVLNRVMKGCIKTLPPRYNFFTNYRYFSYGYLLGKCPSYRTVTEKMFITAKRCPAVIHYAGDERPWFRGNLNHYRRAYELYLEKTAWAGTPKEKGKELYMLAYHVMDYATVLWPDIRWLISSRFGMKMMESRKKK